MNHAAALVAAIGLTALPVDARAARVNSVDITPADGTTGQALTIGSGIKTGHLQNGAVTDSKIAGVSASKITGAIPAAQIEAGVFMKKYSHVVVVAKSGGDFNDPAAALLAIGDASATKPYLVKIMPGVYELGTNALVMKSYVDVEGSGQGVTVIRGQGTTGGGFRHVVFAAAAPSELRSLTIEGIGSAPITQGEYLTLVSNYDGANYLPGASSLRDLTLVGDGRGLAAGVFGVLYAVASDVVLQDVKIRVSGTQGPGGVTVGASAWEWTGPGEAPRVTLRGLDVRLAGGISPEGVNLSGAFVAELRDSSVRVSGGSSLNVGVRTTNITTRITNSTIETEGAGGQAVQASAEGLPGRATYVDHSSLSSTNGGYSTLRGSGGIKVFAAYTKVVGPLVNSENARTCLGLYNENYQPVSCQ
jgi:hypothetical protein